MESNIAGSGSWNRPRKDSFSLSSFRQSEAEQLASDADPWGWVDQDHDEVRQDVSSLKVTAVLVAFDAARWLPDTLAGLDRLQHRPTRLIAIDNGSTDATRTLLDQAVDHGIVDAVYSGKRSFGFGAGVKSALRQDRIQRASSGGDGETTVLRSTANDDSHWLWLLHDDASPAPDALYRLLSHVAADHTIDITGPKLLLPRRRQAGQQISEVGVSISGTGRRDLEIDSGEIDQGQRDLPHARLGVSTCGMLVRMAVWNDLDGLDPAIPVFRDGVEFGWRAHLNGYRVVTTPSAMLTHRQVGRAGLRPRGLTGSASGPGGPPTGHGRRRRACAGKDAAPGLAATGRELSHPCRRLPGRQGAGPGPGRDSGAGLVLLPSRARSAICGRGPRASTPPPAPARWSRRSAHRGGAACGSAPRCSAAPRPIAIARWPATRKRHPSTS